MAVKHTFTARLKPPGPLRAAPLSFASFLVYKVLFADSVLQGVVMSSPLMQALHHRSALVFSIYSAQSVPTFTEVLA